MDIKVKILNIKRQKKKKTEMKLESVIWKEC